MYPILLEIGPVKIFTYGFLVAIGFLIAIFLASKQGEKEGLDPQVIIDLCFYILLSAIVGARVLYVIVEYKYFLEQPMDIFKVWKGGLVFYGGLVLAIFVSMRMAKLKGLPIWKTADILAPSIAIGQAVGRWGCLFAGCCYGAQTDLPLGITFSDPKALAPLNVSLHPTQIYLSLNAIFIFLILVWLRKRKRFHGQIFCMYGILYSIGRFVIEYFRNDDRGYVVEGMLSTSQFIGVLALLVSTFMILKLKKKGSIISQKA